MEVCAGAKGSGNIMVGGRSLEEEWEKSPGGVGKSRMAVLCVKGMDQGRRRQKHLFCEERRKTDLKHHFTVSY